MRLGENEDNQVMFDVSRTPLVDFHHYERLHQEKYFKVRTFFFYVFIFYLTFFLLYAGLFLWLSFVNFLAENEISISNSLHLFIFFSLIRKL